MIIVAHDRAAACFAWLSEDPAEMLRCKSEKSFTATKEWDLGAPLMASVNWLETSDLHAI